MNGFARVRRGPREEMTGPKRFLSDVSLPSFLFHWGKFNKRNVNCVSRLTNCEDPTQGSV